MLFCSSFVFSDVMFLSVFNGSDFAFRVLKGLMSLLLICFYWSILSTIYNTKIWQGSQARRGLLNGRDL